MSSNWWAERLGTPTPNPAPTPPTAPPATPYYPPVPQGVPAQPQAPVTPTASSLAGYCPNCRSGNYGSPDPEHKARCYDCGYPVVQSGSGLGTGISGPSASGPAKPARQSTTANNFNPQGIIGHI